MDPDDRDSADSLAEALGTAIKVLRTDLGMERKDLAERAGISYSYLASIESGTRQPSSQVLVAIAGALGMRSHELLATAERRRDRSLTLGSYPAWLTGERPPPAPMAAASVGARHHLVQETFGTDLAGFIAEITELAERLNEKERIVVLNLARKLAGQRW